MCELLEEPDCDILDGAKGGDQKQGRGEPENTQSDKE